VRTRRPASGRRWSVVVDPGPGAEGPAADGCAGGPGDAVTVALEPARRAVRVRPATLAKASLLAVVVALVSWRVDWVGSLGGLGTSSLIPLGLALVAFTLSAALKAVVWAQILRGVRPGATVRARELLSPVFVGLLGNWLAPARLGEAARVVLGHRRMRRRGVDLGLPAITGTVAAEILVSAAAWAVAGLAAAALLPVPGYVALTAAGAGVLVGGFIMISLRGAGGGGGAPHPPARWPGRLLRAARQSLQSAGAGLRGLARPRALSLVSGAGIAMIVLQWLATFLVLEALGIGVGLAAAAAVLVTTTVAQSLPLLPGGIGSYQAAVALPLVASYGVAGADAIAAAVVLHAAQAATGVAPGLVFLAREDLTLRSLRGLEAAPEAT